MSIKARNLRVSLNCITVVDWRREAWGRHVRNKLGTEKHVFYLVIKYQGKRELW